MHSGGSLDSVADLRAMRVNRLQDRCICESEEIELRRGRRFNLEGRPGRHDEHVTARHVPLLVAHDHDAGTVENLVDGRSGFAALQRLGASPNAMHFGTHRRQHVAAVGRVREADRCVTGADRARLAFVLECELFCECPIRVDPAIGQQRRRRLLVQFRNRAQPRVAPQPLRARPIGRALLG